MSPKTSKIYKQAFEDSYTDFEVSVKCLFQDSDNVTKLALTIVQRARRSERKKKLSSRFTE